MFENSDNEHFRALYFLSHEIRQGNRNTPEDEDLSYWFDPDTQRLFRIRNAMEHRSLKLVGNFCHRHVGHFSNDQDAIDNHVSDIDRIRSELEQLRKAKLKDPSSDLDNQILALEKRIVRLEQDLDEKNRMSNYALVIGVEEFEKLTLKLLTLAKDALIYLSLAIHHEEMKKPQDGLVIPKLIPKK
jgi:hypothetical protein